MDTPITGMAPASLLPDFREHVVATPPVVEYIHQAADVEAQQWAAMFGDRVVKPTAVPEALNGLTLEMEGYELRIVEVGQGDIRPSTVVHIPAIEAVVAGDVVYNQIHRCSASAAARMGALDSECGRR